MMYRLPTLFLISFFFFVSPSGAKTPPSKANLTSKAMRGDIEAQYNLCLLYKKENSNDLAISWCEKAAMAKHRNAQLQLAWLTIHRAENKDDLKNGYVWLSVALAQKYDFSGYHEWKNLGAYFDEKTLKTLRKQAKDHYKKYVDPHEIQNITPLIKAHKDRYYSALEQKAEQGDAESQALLGTIYEYDSNPALALQWYRKAARNGYINAQSYLGRSRSHEGIGSLFDDNERYAWMSIALAQEYNYVDKLTLSLLAEKLRPEKLSEAEIMAQDYFTKYVSADEKTPVRDLIKQAEKSYIQGLINNAEKGDTGSQYDLAKKYKSGIAVLQDTKQSMKWHVMAAEGGNVLAQYTLGHMFEEGIELPKDHERSAKWYKKAASQGYMPAQFALGQLYFKHRDAGSNIIEAYAWLDIAAKQGDPSADITRDAIAKDFDKDEMRLAGILSRKYYRMYVEPFEEKVPH